MYEKLNKVELQEWIEKFKRANYAAYLNARMTGNYAMYYEIVGVHQDIVSEYYRRPLF